MARARSVRLLSIASAHAKSDFSLTNEDWGNIEKGYGHLLPDAVREKILEATEVFVEWEIFERNAGKLQPALDKALAIRKAARNLQRAMSGSKKSCDADSYARLCIKEHFDDTRLNMRNGNLFDALCGVLTSLDVACEQAHKTMNEKPGYREGDCWKAWINSLTEIAQKNELPSGVSKGSDKSAKTSPFVLLVAALQRHVPATARRHFHGSDGLATAIVLARRGRKNIPGPRQNRS